MRDRTLRGSMGSSHGTRMNGQGTESGWLILHQVVLGSWLRWPAVWQINGRLCDCVPTLALRLSLPAGIYLRSKGVCVVTKATS